MSFLIGQVDRDTQNSANDMADYYDYVAREFQEFGVKTQWESPPGSPFLSYKEDLGRNSGPGGSWNDSDAKDLLYIAFTHLTYNAFHLEGVAALLRNLTVNSTLPIVRSIAEAAGRVAWLLHPDLSTRERSARLYLNRLDDASRKKTTMASMKLDGLQQQTLKYKRIRKQECEDKFHRDEVINNNGNFTIIGQRLPGMQDGLGYFESALRRNWGLKAFYDYLCDATHTTLYAKEEGLIPVINPNTGEMRLNLYLGPEFRAILQNGSMLFLGMWKIIAAFMGLDFDAIDDISEQSAEAFRSNRQRSGDDR
jgi:hypothetical protein